MALAQAKLKLEVGNPAPATACAVPLTVTRLKGKPSPSARELLAPVLDLVNEVKSPKVTATASVTNANAFNTAKSVSESPPTLSVEASVRWGDYGVPASDSIVVRVAEQALTALVEYKPSGEDKVAEVCIDVTGIFPANNDLKWSKAPFKVAVPLADLRQLKVKERNDDRTVAITLEDAQQVAVAIEHLLAPSPLAVSVNLNQEGGCALTIAAAPNPPQLTSSRGPATAGGNAAECDPKKISELPNLTAEQRQELIAKCAAAGVAALTQGVGKLFGAATDAVKTATAKDKKVVTTRADLKVPRGAVLESVSGIHVRLGAPGQRLLGKAVLVARSQP